MELVIGIIAGVALGVFGLQVGMARGKRAGMEEARGNLDSTIEGVVQALGRGRLPSGGAEGSAEAELRKALEQGWAPREAEREVALREAIGRVSTFLDTSVRAPLSGFDGRADVHELKERIGRALGALEDLDFFIKETTDVAEGTDIAQLVQRVSKEFVADQSVGVRLALSGAQVRASVNPQALMDALYLVLHNAGRFGGGRTVDLGATADGGRVKITVRDHGDGFTEEAFRRAFDPFYSTSDEGLGLGLPHARKVVESMGGRIELRNVPDRGAEVEISFPAA